MPTNQYVAFAAGGGANTLSNATYQAHAQRLIGHQPGIALSELENTVLRQCSVAAAGVATLATTFGTLDCLDDGSPSNYSAALKNAIDAIIASAISAFAATLTIPVATQGTFTPQLRFGGAGTGITYSAQSGRYLKLDKLVTFFIALALTSKGSSTGAATVIGLPFTVDGQNPVEAGGDLLALPGDNMNALLVGSTTTASLRYWNTSGNPSLLDNTHFNNNSVIYLSGSYLTP